MAERVLASLPLCTSSEYYKVYADIVSIKKFIGAKVTRTWLDKETNEQTDRHFTFSASVKELRELRSNLSVLIKEIERIQGNGMQRRQQLFSYLVRK